MVFYATIDILGYISDLDGYEQINERFKAFVDKYHIVEKLPGVKANDLWGARCSILHKSSPTSKLSKRDKAKEFLYSWGSANSFLAQKVIDKSGKTNKYIAITIEELYNSLVYGIESFKQDLKSNPNLYKICEGRVLREFYSSIPVGK